MSELKSKSYTRFNLRYLCSYVFLFISFLTSSVYCNTLEKNLAFATNQGDNSLSVISLVDFKVIKTIKVGKAPAGIAIDKINGHVFVANAEDKSISVIKTNDLKIVKTIKITGSAVALKFLTTEVMSMLLIGLTICYWFIEILTLNF